MAEIKAVTSAGIAPPARMRRQARIMRMINVPMRRVLSLPFPTPLGKRLMIVTITGRKTGRIYRQPVSYVRDGDALLTPGGGAWSRNLREDTAVPARMNGKDVRLQPELIRDPDQVVALLQTMAKANPRITSFVPFFDKDGIDRTKLGNALEYGFRIVRWHRTD
jgi:hypothetical protein